MGAVLAAATDLFSQKGPDSVTVREIAERAGVNHALIHRHFGTKDELLRLVLAQTAEKLASISAGVSSTRDLTPVISTLLGERATVRLLAWAILSGYPVDQIWPEHAATQHIRDVLADEQEAHPGPPGETAEVTVAAAAALMLGWIIFAPFVERASGFADVPGYDEEATIHRLVQGLFELAR